MQIVDNTDPVRTVTLFMSNENGRILAHAKCFDADAHRDHVALMLEFEDVKLTSESEVGYFYALTALREQLENIGFTIECNGSSENVFPSPMISSMGNGEMAYRLTLGRPARSADLVNIFERGVEGTYTSVKRQQEFYDRWLKSLQ